MHFSNPKRRHPTAFEIRKAKEKAQEAERLNEERKQMWGRLNNLVNDKGGHITSVPGLSPAQLEVLPGSTLPGRLSEIGFDVQFVCQETRVGGAAEPEYVGQGHRRREVRSAGYSFHTVDVFRVELPK